MHLNHLVVGRLVKELQATLSGAVLEQAVTLSKTELKLSFLKPNATYFTITLHIISGKLFLFFDELEPHKRSNAQPVFESLYEVPLKTIQPHPGNRSFEMVFEQGSILVFKLYDGLTNVLLFQGQHVIELFRNEITNDKQLTPESFRQHPSDETLPDPVYYTITKSEPGKGLPYRMEVNDKPVEGCISSLFEVYTLFSKRNLSELFFTQTKNRLVQERKKKIAATEKHLKKIHERIHELEQERKPDELGHLLMANIHLIEEGATFADVVDFYTNQPVWIKLKKELSVPDNAAYYYRKAKNRSIEQQQLKKQSDDFSNEQARLSAELNEIEKADQLKQLLRFEKEGKKSEKAQVPFRVFQKNDFEIWVGKNAANNDILTMKYAHKNDLWLHAKDVSGSHVVVRHKGGKPFPKAVQEYAAQLAATYSTLKGSTMVPVICTLRKFIRKPKGLNPGQVIVDKEEVLLVSPL